MEEENKHSETDRNHRIRTATVQQTFQHGETTTRQKPLIPHNLKCVHVLNNQTTANLGITAIPWQHQMVAGIATNGQHTLH